jgi:integrase/recombinase XerD
MKTAEAAIYLDQLRPKKDGTCSVKIKVTFDRKRKYYSTGIDLTPKEFETIMNGKRKTPDQKEINTKLTKINNRAFEIIQDLKIFTFEEFEKRFNYQEPTKDSISFAIDTYINQLKDEKRINTAVTYLNTKNSLNQFKKDLKLKKDLTFAQITPSFLKKYENWMLDNGKSTTTVGIYLRSLRSIFNLQNIDKSIYPFGQGKDKYQIPTGKNIKKALTMDEIGRIYNYEAVPGSTMDMAKDYWLFLYLCNGMNVKDFCLLKWENIEGEFLTFKRAKTKRSRKQPKPIVVALKPQTLAIIKKWSLPSISKDAYIFPHLQLGMDADTENRTVKQLTKVINKYIGMIAKDMGIDKQVTTYFARHSFATVLKRSGANTEMISDLLGHSSVAVTESYLDSFESDQIQKQTDALTAGWKKAN